MIFDSLNRRDFLKQAAVAAGASMLPAPAWSAVTAQASALHHSAYVFDGHVHALDREFYHGGNITDRVATGQWDLPRATEGGVDAFFLSVYVPEEYYPARFETKQALRRIDHALDQLHKANPHLGLALKRPRPNPPPTRKQDRRNTWTSKAATTSTATSDVLRALHQLGLPLRPDLRPQLEPATTPTPAAPPPQWNGLTPHGRDVVHEMNRLGMVINVSHCRRHHHVPGHRRQRPPPSSPPITASDQANDIPRNIPDALLKKLIDRGGVIGFQIGSEFAYPREYTWLTAHRQKDLLGHHQHPRPHPGNKTIYEIDALVAPTFPMLGRRSPRRSRHAPRRLGKPSSIAPSNS